MGILMPIHIFDFSKTVIQIYFKLGGNVPWVGVYQVCSNGHVPMNLDFFMIFFQKSLQKFL